MTEPVAELKGASKAFGKTKALANASFKIQTGEIVALLGPNGAGKTTALGLLMGLRKPDTGKALLFGVDPRQPRARLRIGVTPQDTALPDNLRVREIIDFVRAHYENPLSTKETLETFGLTEIAGKNASALSGGQKRKLTVALAFAGNPDAVFLDEPTTGLDPAARRALWETARAFVARGGTLLLTTHYLEEAEALASRIILIDHGRIIKEGTVEDVKASVGLRIVRFVAESAPNLPSVARQESEVTEIGTLHTLYCHDADETVRALVTSAVAFRNLEVLPVSLEEAIFFAPSDSAEREGDT